VGAYAGLAGGEAVGVRVDTVARSVAEPASVTESVSVQPYAWALR
jgi:hypothetical protein